TYDNAIDDGGLRITRIRAKNYRSIRELDLELGPLTVLVGPNAAGKSNVLDVLKFLRDAISRGLDLAISQRHGIENLRHQYQNGSGSPRDVELGFRAKVEDITLDYNFILSSNCDGGHRVFLRFSVFEPDP
ncbi:MAG: AAA family ATPase, partial [Chloroflexi bacterium]|nr:AAA family ATPase [Chloroflexota bacterium]